MSDMLLMIDNYDSFTYNLVQYLQELGVEVRVYRNDTITVPEITDLRPERIVLSPGPCSPTEAGICIELVRRLGGRIPMLGVCLGHQSMAAAYGGEIIRAQQLMHGKTSLVSHDERGVYTGLPKQFTAIRYHSLVAKRANLPDCLEVTATADDGDIMGLRYRPQQGFAPLEGVQFHPESILTEHGHALLANFLRM
jgi:anthranilate synthase component 2